MSFIKNHKFFQNSFRNKDKNKEETKENLKNNIRQLESLLTPIRLLALVSATFILVAFMVIAFPQFFAIIFGLFLLFCGILISFLTFKAYQLKKFVNQKLKPMKNSAFIIQQMSVSGSRAEHEISGKMTKEELMRELEKKVTWH